MSTKIKLIGVIDIRQVDVSNGIKISINDLPVDTQRLRLAPLLPLRIFAGPLRPFSIAYWKQFAITCVRIYPRFRLKSHRKIIIHAPKTLLNSDSLNTVKIEANGAEIIPFIARELALDGFMPSFLDLNLDYDLRKNWSIKPLILAFSNFQTIGILKRKKYNQSLTESRSISVDANKTPFGEFRQLSLQNATVFHGQFVANSEYFFPADSMKLPPRKDSLKLPTLNWLNEEGQVIFPQPYKRLKLLNEAIFIGGTNNWMHFVIEDLPRILKLRDSGINQNVPIILRADLSSQILRAVTQLTNREIIQVKVYYAIDVVNLHIIQFTNPLYSAMRGDSETGSKLFDKKILAEAGRIFTPSDASITKGPKRVLIAREPNLFRPMSNFKKLRRRLEQDFGFSTYYLGSMSLEDIIESLASAEIVVGEYGAGLANILFTRSGAKVIEIRGPAEMRALEYEFLVKALGHTHFKVLGTRRYMSLKGVGNGQFSVKINDVIEILGGIIETC